METYNNGASHRLDNSVQLDGTTHGFAGEKEPAMVRGMLHHGHSASEINARIEEALTGLLNKKLGAPGLSSVELVSRLRSIGANDVSISHVIAKLLKATFPKEPVYAHRQRQPEKQQDSGVLAVHIQSEAETYLRSVYPCAPAEEVPQVLLIVEQLQHEANMLGESTTPARLVYRAVGIRIARSLSGRLHHREVSRQVGLIADQWRGIR